MQKLLSLIIVILVFTISCVAQEKKTSEEKDVLTPKDFQSKLSTTPNAVLLDVRTPDEVSQGKIQGSVNIDFNNTDYKKKIDSLDKEKTYFVYCAKGGRSSKAYAVMKSSGFKHVYDLEGGYSAWNEMGLPIVKK
jgi:rhodanese-related sulfurtransferase